MSSCGRRSGLRDNKRRGKRPGWNRTNPNNCHPELVSVSRGVVRVPKGQARNTRAAALRRDGYTVVERV